MINDIIKTIKDAEEKAKETIANAKRESAEIISKANISSKNIVKESEENVKTMCNEMSQKAKKDSEAQISLLKEKYKKEISEKEKIASAKTDEAVVSLIKEIVG